MTIIEILVVVLIIGIIVTIAIPTFSSTGRTAQDGVCAGNLRLIDGAIAQYQAQTGGFPISVADLVSAGYLKTLRPDPHSGYAGYSVVGGDAVADGGHQTYP